MSHYIFSNVNEAFYESINNIYTHGVESKPRNMLVKELLSYNICIENPKDRIANIYSERATDLFYAYGELFWYLSKSNLVEDIEYYAPSIKQFSDNGYTLNSAYGYLIFEKYGDQFKKVIEMLKKDPDSRQAIIFLRSPKDLYVETKDSICTNTIQFLIREGKLNLIVSMRSNDLMKGFLYDSFCFTYLQEMMASCLKIDLGCYFHNANSMHIYEDWFDIAKELIEKNSYLDILYEKEENKANKNPIFLGDTYIKIRKEVRRILKLEAKIRKEKKIEDVNLVLNEILNEKITSNFKDALILLLVKKISKCTTYPHNAFDIFEIIGKIKDKNIINFLKLRLNKDDQN